MASTEIEILARAAYDAYRSAQPGSAPQWGDLSDTEREGWRAAVSTVSTRREGTVADLGRAPSLVIQAGGETHAFNTDFIAGRQGNLAVNDDHASSQHAHFRFAHGIWYVEDLHSTNGTWLNGRRMFAAQSLKKGDKIRIGRTTILVVSA